MGNYAIIVAFSAVVVGSVLMMNARKGVFESQTPLKNHHFKSVAREASLTGLNWSARQLVADVDSWKTKIQTNQYAYGRSGPLARGVVTAGDVEIAALGGELQRFVEHRLQGEAKLPCIADGAWRLTIEFFQNQQLPLANPLRTLFERFFD